MNCTCTPVSLVPGPHHAQDCEMFNNIVPLAPPVNSVKDRTPAPVLQFADTPLNTTEENRRLRTLNRDLAQQVEDAKSNTSITPHELLEFTRIRQEHYQLNAEQNKIVMWLRQYKAKEIALGKHGNMSLADVVIMYMGQTVRKPTLWGKFQKLFSPEE